MNANYIEKLTQLMQPYLSGTVFEIDRTKWIRFKNVFRPLLTLKPDKSRPNKPNN